MDPLTADVEDNHAFFDLLQYHMSISFPAKIYRDARTLHQHIINHSEIIVSHTDIVKKTWTTKTKS